LFQIIVKKKIIKLVFVYPEFILAFIQTYICTNPTTFMGISHSVKILHKTSIDIELWDFLKSNQEMMHCPITFPCFVNYLTNRECMISSRNVSSKYKPISKQASKPSNQIKHSKQAKQSKSKKSKAIEAGKQATKHASKQPTNQPTNYLTPRRRILLERLTVPQPVKKFPAFNETRYFMAVFK